MKTKNIDRPSAKGKHKAQCLSCGTTENMGRRRYCSIECRQGLRYKLNMRTGLLRALNIRYAAFYFSNATIIMDMLPFGSRDIFSFVHPRSAGKRPADDFGRMANALGDIWWTVKKQTNKQYIASRQVFEWAVRNKTSLTAVKPLEIKKPAVRERSLRDLELGRSDLSAPELHSVIKNAFRQQAKRHHPDIGGSAVTFRKVHRAYEELRLWARNPTFIRRRGFVDKWFYDGVKDKWVQPTPIPRPEKSGGFAGDSKGKQAIPL